MTRASLELGACQLPRESPLKLAPSVVPALAGLLCALGLAACSGGAETAGEAPVGEAPVGGARSATQSGPSAAAPAVELPPLPAFMNCVREAGGLLIAAHRGGPAPGYPENALETMQHGLSQGILVFEIDVAESQDGVLYLMHDRSLRRTGGYDGGVADTDWKVVAGLDLRDSNGDRTGFAPPTLSAALTWAKQAGAILELDRKETTSFRNIIEAVRAAGAEGHVVLISYSDDQAKQIARLAPDLMMTARVDSPGHQQRLAAAGVNFENVVAWLGTANPNPRAFAALGRRGIESAFGTLGRAGERLDDQYRADGDASEYQDLVDGGLTLLATDAPYFVARALDADELAVTACARPYNE